MRNSDPPKQGILLGGLGCLLLTLAVPASRPSLAQMPVAEQQKTTLRGTVVDQQNNPVASAIVSGIAVKTNQNGQLTYTHTDSLSDRTTNDRGEFKVDLDLSADGLTISLRARCKNAFTAKPVELRRGDLKKPITLRISQANARALSVRVVDEQKRPIPGATIAAQHRPTAPAPIAEASPKVADLPRSPPARTDAQGKFETPRCFEADGSYQIEVAADGFRSENTGWQAVGSAPVLAFGDVVLKRVRPLEGRVFDRNGKPVSGTRVLYADSRQRVETITQEDGSFALRTAFSPPGWLFVDKAGFRFHGQRCEMPEPLQITLRRCDEPIDKPMATLPPALPPAQRKALAARLLEPLLQGVLEKGSDDARLGPLQMLAVVDPGRLLVELEKRPYANAWYDGYLRRDAAKALHTENFEEARSIVDSMRDAGFRCAGYLDLCDALPDTKRGEKLALLDQALLHSRGIELNDHRVINLGWIARRYLSLGAKDRAAKLLREGHVIAQELPPAAWAGYARGAFAEDLALIDLAAALALMKDLKDPHEYVRHHGNLAVKLAGTHPAEAQRVFGILLKLTDQQQAFQRQRYAALISYRMSASELARARAIAETINEPCNRAWAYGLMAKARAHKNAKEAVSLLDQAFELLATHVASGRDMFNNFYDAATIGGLLLPIAEQIDRSLLHECFWRALALHFGPSPKGDNAYMKSASTGAVALVLARYNRELALALVEQAERERPRGNFDRDTHYRAAALADPSRAVTLVEQLPDGPIKDSARGAVIRLLFSEDKAVRRAVQEAVGVGDEDEQDH